MKSHSIKKLLSVVLMLAMVLSCIPFTALAEEAESVFPESELQNLYLLLNDPSETELKVAYLGGSVTVGSGSSNTSTKSWRALVGQWFVDTYGPGSSYGKNVTNVHAAIGATGSYFGSYRVWQDCQLGSDNPPDVLFIEFAINDIYDVTTDMQTEINYESIIRQAYKANPKITIIPVFTMDNNIAYNYINKGHDDNKYFTIQRTIAEHYGLPQVNVGHALIDVINGVYQAEGKTFKASDSSDASSIWRRYITDSCHPGDAGYAVYADTVIAYLTEQLGDTVAHNEEVKSVDIATTASYASTKGNEAHLKENGRYISFKDAGFTGSDLHGWTLSTTSSESSLESSNGVISTNINNASFAFKFTGTAVGFFNFGKPESGTIDYTITSTEDPTEKYTGSVSLVKNYNGGLPFPGELTTGLENKEWLVECVLRNAGSGAFGQLKYIYIDGDTSSISPATAPQTTLPPITVGASSYTEIYGGSIGELTTYEGLSAKKVVGDTSGTQSPQVDNFRYNTISTKISFPSYKYVGVTYYYVSGGSEVPQNITMQLDQLIYNGSPTGWLPGSSEIPGFPLSIARKTAPLVSGKWVTQYFDFSEFAEAASTLYPGSYLYQGRHYPFGVISGNTMKGTEESWFNSIMFRTELPKFYSADGEKIDYNDGSAIVYVSSEGSVTVGEKTFEAYTAIVDAVNALSPVGGIIRVSGNASFIDGSIDRNKIIIESADETAKLTNINLNVTKGDLELRNISMAGHDDENWTKTNGHTLILGEGFAVDKYVRPGMNGSGKPTNVTMYSGKLKDFGAAANYGGTFTVTGDSHFNIYGGTVVNISGFSRNGTSVSGHHTVNGDVVYNIYGGSISGTLASTVTTGTLNGNLWYNIYGGNFASGTTFGFGDRQGFGTGISPTETRNASIHGNQIFLIDNKKIVENKGSLSGVTIGKKLVNGIYNEDAGLFVIINNAELSETTGAAITASSYADWNLLVSNGKALPVFDENRVLLGFDITSDIENGVVHLENEVILPDENGLYQIEAETGVIRNIVIKNPGAVDVIFTDGTNTQTLEGKQFNPFTLPACTFTKDGYVFSGWKIEGDDTVYVPNQSYTLGVASATFTAQWTLRSDITTVYVDPAAQAGGTGLSANSPVQTFKQAQAVINDTAKDFTIVLSGEFKMSGYNKYFDNHTGTITLDGNGESILSWDSQMYGCGPITLKNIKFRVLASNNFLEADAKDIVFGEGISNLPTVDGGTTTYLPLMHVGAMNTTSPYQNVSMSSGVVNIMYVGSFYNTDAQNPDESKGARIFVDGGKVNNVIFGPDGYSGHNGPAKWTNAASLVIDGGTVVKVSTRAGSIYDYPMQVVVNNGLALPTIDDSANAGVITVTSTEGGRVDVTSTPGVFSITTDSETLYINGILTEKSENGLYTFNTAGTYAVAYKLSEVNFIAGTSDVTGTSPTMAAVAKGSTITLPENTFVRDGFEFVSWYDGENLFNAGAEYAVVGDEANFTPLWKATDGTKAYLSTDDGYADTNGDGIIDVVAHTTFANAINSITAASGGTIYLEGTYSGAFSETSNASRGPVTVRGITNDAANKFSLDTTANYVFTKGDITFDYMTIKAPNDEYFFGISGGYTMTFGENLEVEARGSRYLYVGSPTVADGVSNYVIDGGSFSYIMSGGNYNSSSTHNGDVYYTTNGGTIREYYGGSRNSSGGNKYTTNGNVYHTINGGTFTQNAFLGSHRADKVLGNVIFTVNGGDFGGKSIIAGHNTGNSDTSLIAGVNNVVVVNNASAPEGHNFNLTLGTSGAGKNVGSAEIYIINNCEINTGVAINKASTAAYKIRVNGGSATPVFAEGVGGALLGFDIVSDIDGYIPVVNGTALSKNSDGCYSLTANTTADAYLDITFAPYVMIGGTAIAVSNENTVTAIDGIVDFENSVAPEVSGKLFIGWYDSIGNAVKDGANLTEGVVLSAHFVDFVTDETAQGYNFGIEGAQIRLNGEAALRFVTDFDKELRNTLIELDENLVPADADSKDIGYGFVVLPTNLLGDASLTKETPKCAVIPAVKLYTNKDEESFVRYTACLTGVTEDNYSREYAAVSYITYTDANGIVHTVYGEMYSTSMVEIAKATLDNRVEEQLTEDEILALEAIVGTNN